MKQRLWLILCFFLFLTQITPVWAAPYDDFLITYRAEEYKKSLAHIKKAYESEPGNNLYIYWYGILLHKNEKYPLAITVLKKLPLDYYSYPSQWYLADSYKKAGRNPEAVAVLEKVLTLEEGETAWKKHYYAMLLGTLKEMKHYDRVFDYEKELEGYYRDKPEDFYWIKYLIAASYLEQGLAFLKGENELNKKNEEKALKNFERILYWHSMDLGKNALYIGGLAEYGGYYYHKKDYSKAAGIYSRLPGDIKPMEVRWFYAASLKQLAEYKKGLELMKVSIKTEDDYWDPFNFQLLIELANLAGDDKAVFVIEKELLNRLQENNSDSANYSRYLLCKFFYDKGLEGLKGSVNSQVIGYFDKVEEIYRRGLAKYAEYINLPRTGLYREAGQFWLKKFPLLKKKALVHRFLTTVYFKADGFWTNKEGEKKQVKLELDPSVLENIKAEDELFRKLFFYLTKGEVLIEVDYHKEVESVITEYYYSKWESPVSTGGVPVETFDVTFIREASCNPYRFDFYYNNRNKYDSFITLFPGEGITAGGYSTGGFLPLVPNILSGTAFRGGFHGAAEHYNHRLFLHEFFHNLEGTYGEDYTFTVHVYRDNYKHLWPSWYNGEGELFYLKEVFERVIVPAGVTKMAYGRTADTVSYELFEKSKNLFADYSLSDLQKAKEQSARAWAFYNEKKYARALEAFLASHTLFPYSARVNEMAGWLYYKDKEYKKALGFYQQAYELQKSRAYLTMKAFLYEKLEQKKKALKLYEDAYKEYAISDDLYKVSGLYFALEEYQKAARAALDYLQTFPDDENDQYLIRNLSYIWGYYDVDYTKAKNTLPGLFDRISSDEVKAGTAYYLALAYGETGETGKARQWLKKARRWGYTPDKNIDYYLNKYK